MADKAPMLRSEDRNVVMERLRDAWRDADIAPYSYPKDSNGNEIDFRPNSDSGVHKEVVNRVMERAQEGWDHGYVRHPKYTELEECITSFKWTDEEEQKVVAGDKRKPVSMVIPASKAILDTMVSYYCKALLESPMFRFDGIGPEDAASAILLEKIIEIQASKFQWWLALRTMIRDSLIYGYGIISPQWVTKMRKETQRMVIPHMNPLMARLGLGATYAERDADVVVSEGHKLFNIEPRRWMPDPNVSIDRVQDMEYAFWSRRSNYMDLLSEEQYGGGSLFNVKWLRKSLPAINQYFQTATGRTTVSGIDESDHGLYTSPVDLVCGYCKLIPVEWKLGRSEYPEVWQFTVAGGEILVGAHRHNAKHGMIPVVACAPDYDGYTTSPTSAVETTLPLQNAGDFFFNQMTAAQRKDMSGVNIWNPQTIDLRDLSKAQYGGQIFLHPDYWNRSGAVRDVCYPIPFVNNTGNNLSFVGFCSDMMKMATGASDQMQGMPRQNGERVTAREIDSVTQGAFSRMEMGVTVAAWMAMMNLGTIAGSNTVQYQKQSTWVKLIGSRADQLRAEFGDYVEVDPSKLNFNFDVMPRANTIPGGVNVNALIQLVTSIMQTPQGQRLNIPRYVERVGRETGAGNMDDLFLPPQMPASRPPQLALPTTVVPDHQIQSMLQSGQITPMQGGGGYG